MSKWISRRRDAEEGGPLLARYQAPTMPRDSERKGRQVKPLGVAWTQVAEVRRQLGSTRNIPRSRVTCRYRILP